MDELLSPARGPAERSSSRAIRALGGSNHFSAPQGCVPGPLTFYSQVYREKVYPKNTHSLSVSLLFCSVEASVHGDLSV